MNTIRKTKPLSSTEVSAFCGQLALILKSGISAVEGLTIMCEDASDDSDLRILTGILDDFSENAILSDSLEKTGLFPAYMIQMVKLGEETGTLDNVMDSLSQHYEREADIRRTIKSAVTYPLIMSAMMIAVIVILLMKVMPIFNQVYIQLGNELSGFSASLLVISNGLNRYSKAFLVVLIVIAVLLTILCRTSAGHGLLKKAGRAFPATRKLFENTAACRFASGISISLAAGLPQEKAMELAMSLNEDDAFAVKLAKANKHLNEGFDLHTSLMTAGIFSGMYSRLTSVGEKTGRTDQVMKHIAELYRDELDDRTNNILAAIEPTLVIVLSLIVGIILLSVMLPLIGVMSGI